MRGWSRYNSVRSCDAGIRADLLRNIVCQGGHTRFPGFPERLEAEVSKLVAERGLGSEALSPPTTAVAVVAAECDSAWSGGAAIASLPALGWISRAAYEEEGPTLVHQCCPP